jgi:hypothetical protein
MLGDPFTPSKERDREEQRERAEEEGKRGREDRSLQRDEGESLSKTMV